MLRKTFLAISMVLAVAATSQAAIILQTTSTPLAAGGLVQWQVNAVGNAGEVINTFSEPSITAVGAGAGAHQVFQAFTTGQTPTKTEHDTPGLYVPASWSAYDTYYKFDAAAHALGFGSYTETNDGTTSGTLGLTELGVAPNNPRSGFGSVTSSSDNSKILTPGNAGTNLNFYQVVLKAGEQANMTVRVIGDGGNVVQQFTNFLIGSPPSGNPPVITLNDLGQRELSAGTITAQINASNSPTSYGNLTLVTGNSTILNPASLDPVTGQFTWNPVGSKAGPKNSGTVVYEWTATATNASGTSPATLAIRVTLIPEPATIALMGLAMVGMVGVIRRR